MPLKLLSGGAAQALVGVLESQFKAETGMTIDGAFGAVGGMKNRLLAGESADLLILTRALIEELVASGHVEASIRDVGLVRTAIAVRSGDPLPSIGDAEELRAALLAADGIYFPDPALATAGIHFAKVLASLGIAEAAADRLRTFPNGATAMRALAASTEERPIGCTQITEILAVDGLSPVGMLPKEFELATIYTAGVTIGARNEEAAQRLTALLTSDAAAERRKQAGFE